MNTCASTSANEPSDADTDLALMVQYLSRHDAFCPLCRYNLRGLTRGQCPECGRALTLSVGLVEPYLRAWIVMAASLCASAGTGVFFAIVVVAQGLPPSAFAPACIYFIASMPAAVAALLLRRRFLRLQRHVQSAVAAVALLGTIGGYSLLIVAIVAQ